MLHLSLRRGTADHVTSHDSTPVHHLELARKYRPTEICLRRFGYSCLSIGGWSQIVVIETNMILIGSVGGRT